MTRAYFNAVFLRMSKSLSTVNTNTLCAIRINLALGFAFASLQSFSACSFVADGTKELIHRQSTQKTTKTHDTAISNSKNVASQTDGKHETEAFDFRFPVSAWR